ncbi:hypothetical protein FHU36_003351 [Nonomuraea muscovyensis]|uniref:Transposase n=1 Tax=Nonomuraea muscovyensis TaxID=1124761 RepID=A0A7X0EZJ8_9ACTN|nr:hypothetical protein [Nonomuraea muscovyensis]
MPAAPLPPAGTAGYLLREVQSRTSTSPKIRLEGADRKKNGVCRGFGGDGFRGLDQDRDAVRAAVTVPLHNSGTEGVNTRSKRIMRQMPGRAGFALLHRIHRVRRPG